MKLFAVYLLTFVMLLLALEVRAVESNGFLLTPWKDCTTNPTICKVGQPQEWTQDEVHTLDKILSEFMASDLKPILNVVQSSGYTNIVRLKYGFEFSKSNRAKRDKYMLAFVEHSYKYIAITDNFINDQKNLNDPYTGVPMQKITLLHELAHAFDRSKMLSTSDEFLKLAGFNSTLYYAKADREQMNIAQQETDRLLAYKDEAQSNVVQREFGKSIGLPRLYSTRNAQEAFADLVAFIYYDKDAGSYISEDLVRYIDTNVLQGARAEAQ